MNKRRLLVTTGEPAGIGAEILVEAAWRGMHGLVVLEDPDRLMAFAEKRQFQIKMQTIKDIKDAQLLDDDCLAILPVAWGEEPEAGRPSQANAPIVIDTIMTAATLTKQGLARALITCPIHKSTLYKAGFEHAGHTEFLGRLDKNTPVMMLANNHIRVSPLTVHEPISAVPQLITRDLIVTKARIIDMALRRDFGLSAPHIMVTGLNPHASEDGNIGREEIDSIAPAIADLAREGIHISGPVPADSLFHEDRHHDYDAVLAMYHDQALIPIKTLDFHGTVNITIGLSYIRTSPDHGTALDQAGKGTADPSSLIAAIKMADQLATRRYDRNQ